jgi:calcium/calmodulin-dependent protein kinase I
VQIHVDYWDLLIALDLIIISSHNLHNNLSIISLSLSPHRSTYITHYTHPAIKLGKGAYSVVKLGTHRQNESIHYAIKCINVTKLKAEDIAALKDEVAILTLLRECDHIIRLYDYFDESSRGGYYYMILETMYGGELFNRIVSKSFYNEKEARDTCLILLDAIEYCHSYHVAHRDLKPENLLLCSLTDDSSIKIADFGFAKIVEEPNSLRTQCGTPVS